MSDSEFLQSAVDDELSICNLDKLKVSPAFYPLIEELISMYNSLIAEDKRSFFRSLLKYVTEIPNPELWHDALDNGKCDDVKNLIKKLKDGQIKFKDWATKIYFALQYNKLIRNVHLLNVDDKNIIDKNMVDNFLYFSDFMENAEIKRLKAYKSTDYIEKNKQIKIYVLQVFNSQHFQIELKKALNTKRYKLPMPDGFDVDKLRRLLQKLKESKKRKESDREEKEKYTEKEMQFIDSDTDETIFLSLFQGGIEEGVQIVWTAQKGYFDYLMRELYERKTLTTVIDTIHKIFVDPKGNGLNLKPDPNGRDQKPETTYKQNIIKNIVINC